MVESGCSTGHTAIVYKKETRNVSSGYIMQLKPFQAAYSFAAVMMACAALPTEQQEIFNNHYLERFARCTQRGKEPHRDSRTGRYLPNRAGLASEIISHVCEDESGDNKLAAALTACSLVICNVPELKTHFQQNLSLFFPDAESCARYHDTAPIFIEVKEPALSLFLLSRPAKELRAIQVLTEEFFIECPFVTAIQAERPMPDMGDYVAAVAPHVAAYRAKYQPDVIKAA